MSHSVINPNAINCPKTYLMPVDRQGRATKTCTNTGIISDTAIRDAVASIQHIDGWRHILAERLYCSYAKIVQIASCNLRTDALRIDFINQINILSNEQPKP